MNRGIHGCLGFPLARKAAAILRSIVFAAALALAAPVLATPALAAPARADPAPTSRDAAAAPAGLYVLDPRHASLIVRVSHMGLSSYTVRLDGLGGQFAYDPAHPEASKIAVTVDAASLDVGDPAIGRQFAREFLGADDNPQITFTSTSIQLIDASHGTVTGDLAFHGQVRPVTLAVSFNGYSASLIGGQRLGFSATCDFNRSDFDSRAWLSEVGDYVHLIIEAEFTRK